MHLLVRTCNNIVGHLHYMQPNQPTKRQVLPSLYQNINYLHVQLQRHPTFTFSELALLAKTMP